MIPADAVTCPARFAYALAGEPERAAAELAEARRLSPARRLELEAAGVSPGAFGRSIPPRVSRSRMRPARSTAWAIA